MADDITINDATGVGRQMATKERSGRHFPVHQVEGQRPLALGASLTLTGSYGINDVLGGLVTVSTGLPGGSIVSLGAIQLYVAGISAGASSVAALIYNANPTGSTLTDSNAAVLAAADRTKFERVATMTAGAATVLSGSTDPMAWVVGLSYQQDVTLDASGNFYMAFLTQAALTTASPTAAWSVKLRY